jgi:hypothetical protein
VVVEEPWPVLFVAALQEVGVEPDAVGILETTSDNEETHSEKKNVGSCWEIFIKDITLLVLGRGDVGTFALL